MCHNLFTTLCREKPWWKQTSGIYVVKAGIFDSDPMNLDQTINYLLHNDFKGKYVTISEVVNGETEHTWLFQ